MELSYSNYPKRYIEIINNINDLANNDQIAHSSKAVVGKRKAYWTYLNKVRIFPLDMIIDSGEQKTVKPPKILSEFIDRICKGNLQKAIFLFRSFYKKLDDTSNKMAYVIASCKSPNNISVIEKIDSCRKSISSVNRRFEHNKVIYNLLNDINSILSRNKKSPVREHSTPTNEDLENLITFYDPETGDAFVYNNPYISTKNIKYPVLQTNGTCHLCHRPIINDSVSFLTDFENSEIELSQGVSCYQNKNYCFYHRLAGKQVRRNAQNMLNRCYDNLLRHQLITPILQDLSKDEAFEQKWRRTSRWANTHHLQHEFRKKLDSIATNHFNFDQRADWPLVKTSSKMVNEAIAICSLFKHTKGIFPSNFPTRHNSISELKFELISDVFFPEVNSAKNNKEKYINYYEKILSPCEFIYMLREIGKYRLIKIGAKDKMLMEII